MERLTKRMMDDISQMIRQRSVVIREASIEARTKSVAVVGNGKEVEAPAYKSKAQEEFIIGVVGHSYLFSPSLGSGEGGEREKGAIKGNGEEELTAKGVEERGLDDHTTQTSMTKPTCNELQQKPQPLGHIVLIVKQERGMRNRVSLNYVLK